MMRTVLPLVIVQPGVTYGPGVTREIRPLIVRYLQRKLRALPKRTAYCWAHVDDTAPGHLLAMEKRSVGQAYIMLWWPHTMTDALPLVERVTRIPASRFHASA